MIDVYKKRNSGDLYGTHQNTIDLIYDQIQEQERLNTLKEKNKIE